MFRSAGLAIVAVITTSCFCSAQTNVLTYHNDNFHTGQNLNEITLTPATVNAGTFGKLFLLPADGKVDAQPLYVGNLMMMDQTMHNVVFVATEHDSVYAYDADSAGA